MFTCNIQYFFCKAQREVDQKSIGARCDLVFTSDSHFSVFWSVPPTLFSQYLTADWHINLHKTGFSWASELKLSAFLHYWISSFIFYHFLRLWMRFSDFLSLCWTSTVKVHLWFRYLWLHKAMGDKLSQSDSFSDFEALMSHRDRETRKISVKVA